MSRRASLVTVLTLVLCACQPVDGGGAVADVGRAEEEPATRPPAAPEVGVPSSLGELLERAESTASQWQAGARPVQIVVELMEDDWVRGTVTYLAPDADRFLLVRLDADGLFQERPTLDTLLRPEVTGPGLRQVPQLPDGVLEPGPLVTAAVPVREGCGASAEVTAVVYATGAPAAWDGANWMQPPVWTAVLSDADEGAVEVDPVTGAATGGVCVSGLSTRTGDSLS